MALQALMRIASGEEGYCPDYCSNPQDAHELAAEAVELLNVPPHKSPLMLDGWPTTSEQWPKANKYLTWDPSVIPQEK